MARGDRRDSWIIGGSTLIGLGVGFILLETSVLWFVSSLLIGLGAGLVLSVMLRA